MDIVTVLTLLYLSIMCFILVIGYLVKFNEAGRNWRYGVWVTMACIPILNIVSIIMMIVENEFKNIDKEQVNNLKNIVYFLPLLSLGLLYFI